MHIPVPSLLMFCPLLLPPSFLLLLSVSLCILALLPVYARVASTDLQSANNNSALLQGQLATHKHARKGRQRDETRQYDGGQETRIDTCGHVCVVHRIDRSFIRV